MKKMFIIVLPGIAIVLAVFCSYPPYISSPAPFAKKEPANDETLFLTKIIQAEKKSIKAAIEDKPLDKVVFDYLNKDIESESSHAAASLPEQEMDPDSFAIVGLGDSLTAGTGSEFNRGYLNHVKKYYEEQSGEKVVLVNHGVYGFQTGNLLTMLEDPDLSSDIEKADMLFMTIGGNDIVSILNENFTHLSMDDFKKGEEDYTVSLRKIMSTIRLLNEEAPVYFIGIFNPVFETLPEVKEFNDIITGWNLTSEKVLKMYPNTMFIPIQQLFEKDTHLFMAKDDFHPNDEGYRLIGEEIISRTEEMLMVQR